MLPQYPCSEQQAPHLDPAQVTPFSHVPSVLITRDGVGDGDGVPPFPSSATQ